MESKFSSWYAWNLKKLRKENENLKFPGVYVVARSRVSLHGKSFAFVKEIIYVGMTNSIPGLAGRLRQFEETVLGTRNSHGGADRVRFKHPDFAKLRPRLYVAVAAIKCDVQSNQPGDLRKMGTVVKLEYDCLAAIVEAHGSLPEFNDKKNAPKYSLTVGRQAK